MSVEPLDPKDPLSTDPKDPLNTDPGTDPTDDGPVDPVDETAVDTEPRPDRDRDWWRSAVVYQIYPRSFADADGDGTGDVRGMIDHLDHLSRLGVDAIWVSPWYPSPMADGGYDVADYCDIHPDFGTLADADEFVTQAHDRGLRVLIDLVPNHCSDAHPLFQAALAAGPGSAERDLFVFADGSGPDGDQPPTNWTSLFGGSAWQRVIGADGVPEQWYLHLFAPEQPDWNWDHPAVADLFDDVLRFWFDRGIDGFRIDVADSMKIDPARPDMPIDPSTGVATLDKYVGSPVFDRPEVAEIHQRWRAIADEYEARDGRSRIFVSEAYLTPADRLVKYVAPGNLHTTFNFDALLSEWSATSLHHVIQISLDAHAAVGAPCTWVLSNHDVPRVVSRYGRERSGVRFTAEGIDPEDLGRTWQDLFDSGTPDLERGRRRARAAALLELALPGGAYLYQGDELGLPEVEDLPEEVLQDPSWERSGHTVRGRDGCRVPLPWSGMRPSYGFSAVEPGLDRQPWLPQPADWARLTVAAQGEDVLSHLSLYRAALTVRSLRPELGDGDLRWGGATSEEVLHFIRGERFHCLVNFGQTPVELPAGSEVLMASGDVSEGVLVTDTAVWLEV